MYNMSNGEATGKDSLHEAFELFNLEAKSNSSLLEFGLNLGFIEKQPNGGRLTIELLNAYPMSNGKLVENLITELLLRLGVFIPATSLIKMAIDLDDEDLDQEDTIKCVYILSIILHQIVNFDETSIRTLNRLLMCIAITLFSLTRIDSKPCDEMRKFKQKIKRRLLIDYYLWCLMFAMNFVLTCGSPILINLEQASGIERHIFQTLLNTFCTVHLCYSMRSIGYGRLVPLIFGTPLLFMDAGDVITVAKTLILSINYFSFWLSDWRELVDWNHSMLCEAGICKILNSEPGSLTARVKKAKTKFDEWRLEEGLDDDGWFILLDTPPAANVSANGSIFRPQTNGTNSTPTSGRDQEQQRQDGGDYNDNTTLPNEQTSGRQEGDRDDPEELGVGDLEQEEEEDMDDEDAMNGQRLLDYSDRVIYLQSRNPLLTSLAAVLLIVWK